MVERAPFILSNYLKLKCYLKIIYASNKATNNTTKHKLRPFESRI